MHPAARGQRGAEHVNGQLCSAGAQLGPALDIEPASERSTIDRKARRKVKVEHGASRRNYALPNTTATALRAAANRHDARRSERKRDRTERPTIGADQLTDSRSTLARRARSSEPGALGGMRHNGRGAVVRVPEDGSARKLAFTQTGSRAAIADEEPPQRRIRGQRTPPTAS